MAAAKTIVASERGQIADVSTRVGLGVRCLSHRAMPTLFHLQARESFRGDIGARARLQAQSHLWRHNAGRIIDAYQALFRGAN
jgi:hypothetical protein